MNFPDVGTIIFMFIFYNTIPIIAYIIGLFRIHSGNGKWNWYIFGVSFTLFVIYSVNFSIYYGGSVVIFLTFLVMIIAFFVTKKAIKKRNENKSTNIVEPPESQRAKNGVTSEEIRSFIFSIISGVVTALLCKLLGL